MSQNQTTQSDWSDRPHKSDFEAEMGLWPRFHSNSYRVFGKSRHYRRG